MADIIPYIQSCFKGIKGIVPTNVYEDRENSYIVIPVIRGSNITQVREDIVNRLKNTWVKNYIEKLEFCYGDYILYMKKPIEKTLNDVVNEALEISVIKDGDLKMPLDELVVRNYDERTRYSTDWITEYNYVSEKSLTPEEFEKIIKDAGQEPVGQIYPLRKKKLTYSNGKVYYRHILKTAMY